MTEGAPLSADPAAVRAFVERLHAHAAGAFSGVRDPGMIQLVRIHPATEDTIASRFAIGEVDYMADEAVRQANAGYNVYVEARTVRKTADKRGSIADTVGVFGFVNDADADKGKAGHLAVEPSLVVETSPGNFHHWLLLDRAIPADAARSLGAAIRAKAGADAASGVLTQPYRIPGTPNFPGKRKLARGRVATQTGIVSLDGKIWSLDELRSAFPEVKKKARAASSGETGPSGQTSVTVEAIVAETDAPDRSERFFDAVRTALSEGLTPGDVEALMRQHPDGCAGKYLEPYDRLRREIDRAWDKVGAQAEEIRQAAENPTYADTAGPIAAARQAVTDAVRRFIDAAVEHNLSGDEEAAPPVHALAVTTGVGKTFATAKAVAEHIKSRAGNLGKRKPVLYAVPTHRLGDEIERQFTEHGVTARVFRGRQADDPSRPGHTMCDDLEAVDIALSLGEAVETSCCKLKKALTGTQQCEHYATCSYQAQKADRPDVWIVAHQMLFKAQAALGAVEMVIVDEGFWQSGLRIPKRGISLDELRANLPFTGTNKDYLHNDVETFRNKLARALLAQDGSDGPGGVRREHLLKAGLTGQICTTAIEAEWKLKGKATIYPGMPRAERRKASQAASHAKHVRGYVGIWKGARELLYNEEATTSGRLYIEHRDDDGDGRVLVVKARSLKDIAAAWRVPTMLLDATMPSPDILRAYYPQVEIPAPVEAAMPHVEVRQVLGAPVAARKLKADDDGANRNLRAVRREILRRFVELGRGTVLVIAQKAAADWLRGSGLPAGVAVEHFNNVAGLDRYRDVRGLMVIGRTIPSPAAVEALAGALTGREGAQVAKGEWYAKEVRGIRTSGGEPAGIECDAHPDPVAEACRWQICEGELMQAIGRARGVNRTPASPLAIDVLANVCLPLTVNEVVNWSPPGEEFEMLAEGVVLDSAADMATAWPDVWATPQAARNWLHRRGESRGHTVADPYKNSFYIGIRNSVRFRYQRSGRNQKWRTGAFDPAAVADPRAWLEARLGPLAGFSLETAAPPSAPAALPRAADIAPTLIARFRVAAERPAVAMHLGGTPATVGRMTRRPEDAPIAFPGILAGRLNLMRAAEVRTRRPVAETVQ